MPKSKVNYQLNGIDRETWVQFKMLCLKANDTSILQGLKALIWKATQSKFSDFDKTVREFEEFLKGQK